jgi:cellulose synthase/poly-beta-1,6-N-acetylglucosamine synthase-like glycosyltransferase
MTAVVIVLWLATAAVLWPSLVFFFQCLCARSSGCTNPASLTGVRPRIAVLVPAHDEESGIATIVCALRTELTEDDRLLVVADNCTDGTASAAAAAGAEVIERFDRTHHGKGYALAYGTEHLAKRPPQVVIIVDADCCVSEGGLDRLARVAAKTGRPVQAEYLLSLPAKPDARSAISGLAFLVRNLVRPRGMHRLGFPCQLTGSGMAFLWPLLRDAPPLRANLVEDLRLGIELALAGTPPVLCSAVSVSSALPDPGKAQLGQRRRWEHGHLSTLLSQGPRLLWAGIAQWRADLVAMAFDLMVPPLALLVTAVAGLSLLAAGAAVAGASTGPLLLGLVSGLVVLLAVLSAWWRFARHLLPARLLASVPAYVLWKMPLYLGFFLRGRHKRWERTTRATGAAGKPIP